MLKLVESGVTDKMLKAHKKMGVRCEDTVHYAHYVFSFHDTLGGVYLLAAGITVSCAVLCAELITKRVCCRK